QLYRDNGYLVVPDLIDPPTLAALTGGMERITTSPHALPAQLRARLHYERNHAARLPADREITPEECGEAIRNVPDLPLFDPRFAGFICYRPLLDVLEALFGSREFIFWFMDGRP